MPKGADERGAHNTRDAAPERGKVRPRVGSPSAWWIAGASLVAVALAIFIVAAVWVALEPGGNDGLDDDSEGRSVQTLPVRGASAQAPPEVSVASDAVPPAKEGIGVFPPLGTEPPKRGMAVPEDFQLPPGYVRHYQAADDGRRVEPILMFHPDHHPVAADGTPIPLPADRVVPPELAPPGFPIPPPDAPPSAVPGEPSWTTWQRPTK